MLLLRVFQYAFFSANARDVQGRTVSVLWDERRADRAGRKPSEDTRSKLAMMTADDF